MLRKILLPALMLALGITSIVQVRATQAASDCQSRLAYYYFSDHPAGGDTWSLFSLDNTGHASRVFETGDNTGILLSQSHDREKILFSRADAAKKGMTLWYTDLCTMQTYQVSPYPYIGGVEGGWSPDDKKILLGGSMVSAQLRFYNIWLDELWAYDVATHQRTNLKATIDRNQWGDVLPIGWYPFRGETVEIYHSKEKGYLAGTDTGIIYGPLMLPGLPKMADFEALSASISPHGDLAVSYKGESGSEIIFYGLSQGNERGGLKPFEGKFNAAVLNQVDIASIGWANDNVTLYVYDRAKQNIWFWNTAGPALMYWLKIPDANSDPFFLTYAEAPDNSGWKIVEVDYSTPYRRTIYKVDGDYGAHWIKLYEITYPVVP